MKIPALNPQYGHWAASVRGGMLILVEQLEYRVGGPCVITSLVQGKELIQRGVDARKNAFEFSLTVQERRAAYRLQAPELSPLSGPHLCN